MIIEGISKRRVEVDINPNDIIEAAVKIFDGKFKLAGDYIDDKGFWHIYDNTHPHDRDDVYRIGPKATDEEIAREKFRRELLNCAK